ncbi:MAG: hypothetical protein NW237_12345 [Cyanobacteriota bacterium]|nr:hypothetical protein [Cyanobacteriota bacterium]
MTVDHLWCAKGKHILPRTCGELTILVNLCLAYPTCNEYKSDTTETLDPVKGVTNPLFHPRQQAARLIPMDP